MFYRAAGVVIQWEDTFPYEGELSVLKNKALHYSRSEVQSILESAEQNGKNS